MVDTTVRVAGVVWPRFPHEVLQHGLRGDFALTLFPTVIGEARRKFAERFAAFAQDFEDFLVNAPYEQVSDPTAEDVRANERLMRDITDVPVALAAIKARVDSLITEDKDYTAPAQPIHDKLKVLLPGTFLNQVMGWSHEDLERIRRRTWADLPTSEA
jgi:predicted nucleic acid-binding protein